METCSSLIENVLSDLTVLKKNISIYPPAHPSVRMCIAQLFTRLKTLFADMEVIKIFAAQSCFIINGKKIEKPTRHMIDFATFLNQRGIASVSFCAGVTEQDLLRFYRCMLELRPGSNISDSADAQALLDSMAHIKIAELDFSAVRLADETEAEDDGTEQKGADASTIWEAFYLGSTADGAPDETLGQAHDGIHGCAPERFIALLKECRIPAEQVLKSYDGILTKNFNRALPHAGKRADGKIFFKTIYDILPDLSPELKAQILSTTFRHIATGKNEAELTELLCCMPGDMIVTVLKQAQADNKELSPALIRLLSNLAGLQKNAPDTDTRDEPKSSISWEHMQMLFSRERYEDYVPEQYRDRLDSLADVSSYAEKKAGSAFATEDIVRTLEDDNLNRQLTCLLLALMEQDLDEHAYRDFAGSLSGLVRELLKKREYVLLSRVYKNIRGHALMKKQQIVRNAATEFLKIFSDPVIISRVAAASGTLSELQQKEFEEFVVLCGRQHIGWLLDAYAREKQQPNAERIFAMLCRFGTAAATEAVTRLHKAGSAQTAALLRVVRGCGDASCIEDVRTLLNRSDIQLKLEAIKTLVRLRDTAVVPVLRELLLSANASVKKQILLIVREYSVKELAPDLAAFLKTRYITGADLKQNKAVLGILGELGNENVLPRLNAIARTRVSITPLHLRRTKEFLYTTLDGYPRARVKNLVLRGLRSSNKTIQNICRSMNG